MKRDLQKLIKELSEYFEKRNISDKEGVRTLAYVDDGTGKDKLNDLSFFDFVEAEDSNPCASYADYDDIKDELNFLLDGKAADETLFDLVEAHLKEKGLKPSEVYRKAQISKQDFSRYVRPNAESISRTMVFNLAIGLRLDFKETKRLLKSAGFGFNSKSKFDIIVMYCIKRELYDVTLINMLLDEFKQPLLKSQNYRENGIKNG